MFVLYIPPPRRHRLLDGSHRLDLSGNDRLLGFFSLKPLSWVVNCRGEFDRAFRVISGICSVFYESPVSLHSSSVTPFSNLGQLGSPFPKPFPHSKRLSSGELPLHDPTIFVFFKSQTGFFAMLIPPYVLCPGTVSPPCSASILFGFCPFPLVFDCPQENISFPRRAKSFTFFFWALSKPAV